jgi:hypothetical protein
MSISSSFPKDSVQEACQQFTSHLSKDLPPPSLSKQTSHTLVHQEDGHGGDVMTTTDAYNREILRRFCSPWAAQHRYGANDINRLAQMLPHASASLHGKLGLKMTLDDIMQLWVENSLKQYLPEEPFEAEQVKEIAQRLHSYSIPNCVIILQRLHGPLSQAKLLIFFNFIHDYSITDSWLKELFAQSLHIDNVISTLHRSLFIGALTQRFHYVQEAVEIAQKFYAQSWPIQDIVLLLRTLAVKAGDKTQDTHALEVLKLCQKLLDETKPKPEDFSLAALSQHLNPHPAQDWLCESGKYFVFKISRNIKSILAEPPFLVNLNPALEQEYIDAFYAALQLNARHSTLITELIYDAPLFFFIMHEFKGSKPIHTWQAEEIGLWAQHARQSDKPIDIGVKLVVLKRAVFLAHGYTPRLVQLLVLYTLYQANSGRLAEIATGEGKSLITAMFAILKTLDGKKVDIVTSSPLLAQRDAEEQTGLYALFNLTVAHNIARLPYKPCYEKDIVYGDVINYIADRLALRLNGQSVRGNRPIDVVMIDEVDNAFIDQGAQVTMLVQGVAGFEHLEPLLAMIWQQVKQINSQLAYDQTLQSWIWIEGPFHYQQGEILLVGDSQAYVVDDPMALSRKMLTHYLDKLLAADQPLLHLPTYLKPFVQQQKTRWIESAIRAQYYVEGKDYVLSHDAHQNAVISVVDYRNTGVVLDDWHWSDGLHQFLQIKHGIKIKPEMLMSKYMSNLAFFKSYASVYGLTGTLGIEEEKAFIHHAYQADFIKIPTYKPKQFTEWAVLVKHSTIDWLATILESLQTQTNKGRAVLLILETINQVEQLEKILLDSIDYSADKVRVYHRNDRPSDIQSKKVDVGDIIIATNLAGRGTDLKTTAALEKNGGMHVCIGYLPANLRVQLQAYGRTARQGNQGTGQMILDAEVAVEQLQSLYPSYQPRTSSLRNINAADLLAWRDLAAQDQLLKDQYIKHDLAQIKDELFTQFLQLAAQCRQAIADSIDENIDELRQVEDLWGLWLKEQEELLSYPLPKQFVREDIALFQQKNQQIREILQVKFAEFAKVMQQNWNAGTIIQNPAYLAQKAYRLVKVVPGEILNDLKKAHALDPIFSFTANYLQALAHLLHSETAKQEAYDSLLAAHDKIAQLLPQLESMLAIVNFRAVEQMESELSQQIIHKIALLHKMDEYIVRAAEIIAKSQPEEKIRIKSFTSLQNVMLWEDKYGDEILEFEDAGLIELFEVEPFKEKKNWLGTGVALVCGIFQVVIGVMLAPTTGGMSASLIVSGVSDIFASVKSVITGMPIDLQQYLTAKGIELAVTYIMIGIDNAKQALTGAKEVGKQTAANQATKEVSKKAAKEALIEGVKREFAKRAIITGIAYVTEVVLDKGLRNHAHSIEESVRQDVANLINHYTPQIELALFCDEIAGAPLLQNELRTQALQLLKQYQSKYHSASRDIIKGVAENTASRINPGLGVAFKAADIGHSISQISKVTKDFSSDFGQYLADAAKHWTLPEDMLRQKLAQSFPKADVDNIMRKMMQHQIVRNRHVVNCPGLAPEHVKEYHAKFKLILDLCFTVEKADKSDKRERLTVLKEQLSDVIASAIIRLIQGEVIAPLSSMAGMWGGEALFTSLQQAQQEVIKQFTQDQPLRNLQGQPVLAEAKPASQTNLQVEQLFEFTLADEIQVNHYAQEVLHHQGGLLDVEILSKVGKMNLHLSIDNIYEGSAYHAVDETTPEIHLNYDTETNKWQSYDPVIHKMKVADSVYQILGSYTDMVPSTLREMTQYYIQTNPTEVATLLNTYDILIELRETESTIKDTKPSTKAPEVKRAKPQLPKAKSSATKPAFGTNRDAEKLAVAHKEGFYSLIGDTLNEALLNNIIANEIRKIGKNEKALQEDLKRIDAHLEKNHKKNYDRAKLAKSYIDEFFSKIGYVIEEFTKISFKTNLAAINQPPEFGSAIEYSKTHFGPMLNEWMKQYTDPEFHQGATILGEVVGVMGTTKFAASLGKGTAKQVAQASKHLTQKINASVNKLYSFEKLVANGGMLNINGKPMMNFATLSSTQKMVVGELFGEETIKRILPDAQRISRAMHVGQNGIDDLYKVNKPGVDYVIVEYKFGTSTLKNTIDGKQMSDSWLVGENTGFNRILDSLRDNKEMTDSITKAMKNKKVEKWFVHTNPIGRVSIGLLDKDAKLIPKPELVSKILGGTIK